MKDGALFVGWGAPLPGREIFALEVFNEVKLFFEGLKKKNEITNFEPFLLSHYGGPLRGFFILRGEPIQLAALVTREDFIRLTEKAALAVKNLTIVPTFVGDGIPKLLETVRTTSTMLTTHPV
jgi:hypothetical protein